jgi:hypothetical protein
MILDARVAPLVPWFASLQEQAIAAVSLAIDGVCITGLRRVQELLAAVREVGGRRETGTDQIGWRAALEQEIRPVTRAVQAAMRGAEARFTTHAASQPLRAALRARLAALPDALALEVDPKDPTSQPLAAPGPSIPLRRWFELTLGAALCGIFEALEEQLGAALAAGNAELARIETVLDYHLFIVDEGRDVATRDESARVGLDHAIRLVQAQEAALDGQRERALRRFLADSSSQMDDALAPLRARRPDEILRALATHDSKARPGPLRAWTTRALTGLRAVEARVAPLARELLVELRGRGPRDGHWDLIIHGRRLRDAEPLPDLYRRLFGDIPLGASDLYQPRPELEGPCRAAFAAWADGGRASLLVVGDRGAGKRTLVNRVRAEIRADVPVHWLTLGPHLAGERALARVLAELLDAAPADRLAALTPGRSAPPRRQVIVLERLEFAFTRTPAGVDALRGFTDLMRSTAGSILWITLVSSPALSLLDACVPLSRRFTHVVTVGPASRAFIEQVVRSRHRASGFGLRFEAPSRLPLQRIQRHLALGDRLPDVGDEWFAELRQIAGGNLLQALHYWQLAASLDPRTAHHVLVRPLPRQRGAALTSLTLEQQLVLAALIQHGGLAEVTLLEILGLPPDVIRPELDELRRRALVTDTIAGVIEVPSAAWHPAATDLRARNILSPPDPPRTN